MEALGESMKAFGEPMERRSLTAENIQQHRTIALSPIPRQQDAIAGKRAKSARFAGPLVNR